MNNQLIELRAKMKEHNIDAYLIPTSDYHDSEYVDDYFACREFITGFTGSAGIAVVLMDWAGLWTDGRYFVQAARELEGTGVELMRSGQDGVLTIEAFLSERLERGMTLGFDGRVVNAKWGEELCELMAEKEIQVDNHKDLVAEIWSQRPLLPMNPIWIFDEKYAGKSAKTKLTELRAYMDQKSIDLHILTPLDEIAWLLNIRGNDIACTPVALSYLTISKVDATIYINKGTTSEEVQGYFEELGVTIKGYDDIYEDIKGYENKTILIEKGKVNYSITSNIKDCNIIIDETNPVVKDKAMKNPIEVENSKIAHIKDGVAIAKFHYWLTQNIGKIPMDELSVTDVLWELRKEQGSLEPSFHTISAYGANAAMCHYRPTPTNFAVIEQKGLYLVDSGGQYLEGTTDITRTIAVGALSQVEKEHYTLVLIGMLRLANARFLQGCTGLSLDYLARGEMWKRGLDYNHGTGHGVGHLLGVHERPVGIGYRVAPNRKVIDPILPGMILSDEPGMYVEGEYGIRIENMLVCKEDIKNSFGQFLSFDYLTCAPIDTTPIVIEMMNQEDVDYLNAYHAFVYDKLEQYLEKEEAQWLREITKPLVK